MPEWQVLIGPSQLSIGVCVGESECVVDVIYKWRDKSIFVVDYVNEEIVDRQKIDVRTSVGIYFVWKVKGWEL